MAARRQRCKLVTRVPVAGYITSYCLQRGASWPCIPHAVMVEPLYLPAVIALSLKCHDPHSGAFFGQAVRPQPPQYPNRPSPRFSLRPLRRAHKKSPQEARAAAEARQARAERLRLAQLEEKVARLKERAAAQAARSREDGAAGRPAAAAAAARYGDKHQRSEALREAHLNRIKAKASDEARKVGLLRSHAQGCLAGREGSPGRRNAWRHVASGSGM
jgi:hypothetical protein